MYIKWLLLLLLLLLILLTVFLLQCFTAGEVDSPLFGLSAASKLCLLDVQWCLAHKFSHKPLLELPFITLTLLKTT